MYDLSPYDFLLLCMHVISAMLYTALGFKIIELKKYLKWNKHIYPRLAISSFGLAVVFISEIVAHHNYNIFFHLFMWLFAFNQFAELFRLVDKYNKIQELEKQVNMKNTIILLVIFGFLLTSCGSRKVEMEQMKNTHSESVKDYEKQISDMKIKVTEKTQSETEIKKELESRKTQVEKLQTENKKLVEKLSEEKKDDISIKNANGLVTVTDANGNTYQIPSTQGTEISKKSESTLSKELSSVTETLNQEKQTNEFLRQNISQSDKAISEKEAEINAYMKLVKEKQTKINDLESEKKKNSERKAYPIWYWLIAGAGAMLLLQLAWKIYKPKKKLI